jgi:hypothetical protein
VFAARSKAEAGRLLYERLSSHEQARTSPAALARYCGQLFWCPRHERLWFRVAVTSRPRMLYPAYMPEELWGGVEEAGVEDLDSGALIRPTTGPEEVSAAEFRARVAVAQHGLPNKPREQAGDAKGGPAA